MATSYANAEGTGDRRSSVLSSLQNMSGQLHAQWMLDGTQADNGFWGVSGTVILEFWFPSKKLIDEAIWYQDVGNAQGTFKWQGSDDHVTWTDIGSTFSLGATATQTHTSLNGNTTPYRSYRLLQTAGATNTTPWLREVEFKLEEAGATTYLHAQGMGSRTGSITQTDSGDLSFTGTPANLLDGAFAQNLFWANGSNVNKWVRWDFGAAVTLQQARLFQSGAITHGTWQWEGSPNGSAWTSVGATYTLGANSIPTRWPSGGTLDLHVAQMGDLAGNLDGYRYWRILGVSGSVSQVPWLYEVEFQLADGGLSGGGVVPQIMHHRMQQGMT